MCKSLAGRSFPLPPGARGEAVARVEEPRKIAGTLEPAADADLCHRQVPCAQQLGRARQARFGKVLHGRQVQALPKPALAGALGQVRKARKIRQVDGLVQTGLQEAHHLLDLVVVLARPGGNPDAARFPERGAGLTEDMRQRLAHAELVQGRLLRAQGAGGDDLRGGLRIGQRDPRRGFGQVDADVPPKRSVCRTVEQMRMKDDVAFLIAPAGQGKSACGAPGESSTACPEERRRRRSPAATSNSPESTEIASNSSCQCQGKPVSSVS